MNVHFILQVYLEKVAAQKKFQESQTSVLDDEYDKMEDVELATPSWADGQSPANRSDSSTVASGQGLGSQKGTKSQETGEQMAPIVAEKHSAPELLSAPNSKFKPSLP